MQKCLEEDQILVRASRGPAWYVHHIFKRLNASLLNWKIILLNWMIFCHIPLKKIQIWSELGGMLVQDNVNGFSSLEEEIHWISDKIRTRKDVCPIGEGQPFCWTGVVFCLRILIPLEFGSIAFNRIYGSWRRNSDMIRTGKGVGARWHCKECLWEVEGLNPSPLWQLRCLSPL